MKRMTIALVVLICLCAGSAFAASIGGRLALTARGGMTAPANDRLIDGSKIETDKDFTYGGGLLYGVNNNVAVEADFLYSRVHGDYAAVQSADIKTADVALGVQYRFLGTAPFQRAVPYVGAGFDVLVPDVTFKGSLAGVGNADVSPAVGGHLKAGVDLFLNRQIALNVEVKGLLAAESDITAAGVKVGSYDGSNVSGTVGLRLFFN